MPNFDILINELQKLYEELNEEQLDERIMTKKQAARKRKARAKKRAAKRAAQQAELQKQIQLAQQNSDEVEKELSSTDVEEKEPETDGGGGGDKEPPKDNNSDENEDEEKEFKPLILYDEKLNKEEEQQYNDYSEGFKNLIKKYNEIIQKYTPMFAKAKQTWEQAGKDKSCPQDAWNLLKQAMDGCQKDFEEFTNSVSQYQDLREEELNYIEIQMTAINRFLEDYGKAVDALHPEELKLPANIEDELSDSTDLVDTNIENKTNTDTNKSKQDNKNKKDDEEDLITLLKFNELTKEPANIWKQATEAEKELTQTSWKEFVKKLNPLDWFEDRIWSFINSPVVNDLIKTLMYSNPITAMLYNGDILNFGVKQGLQNIKAQREKQKAARDKAKSAKNKDADFYDFRGVPKDVSKLKVHDLKVEFYGKKPFVTMVNTCYNHPDTSSDDRRSIKRIVDKINKAVIISYDPENLHLHKDEDINRADFVKNFNELIKKVTDVADYNEWNDKKTFEQAVKDANANIENVKSKDKEDSKKAASEKEKKIKAEIKKHLRDKKKTDDDIEIAILNNPNYELDISSDEDSDYVQDLIKKVKASSSTTASESFQIIKELQQLCEMAEA